MAQREMRWLNGGSKSTLTEKGGSLGRELALFTEIRDSLTGNSGSIAGSNWFCDRKLWLIGKMVWLSARNNSAEAGSSGSLKEGWLC